MGLIKRALKGLTVIPHTSPQRTTLEAPHANWADRTTKTCEQRNSMTTRQSAQTNLELQMVEYAALSGRVCPPHKHSDNRRRPERPRTG